MAYNLMLQLLPDLPNGDNTNIKFRCISVTRLSLGSSSRTRITAVRTQDDSCARNVYFRDQLMLVITKKQTSCSHVYLQNVCM